MTGLCAWSRGSPPRPPTTRCSKSPAQLEAMRERTPRGGTRWHPSSVKHLLGRAERLGLAGTKPGKVRPGGWTYARPRPLGRLADVVCPMERFSEGGEPPSPPFPCREGEI